MEIEDQCEIQYNFFSGSPNFPDPEVRDTAKMMPRDHHFLLPLMPKY